MGHASYNCSKQLFTLRLSPRAPGGVSLHSKTLLLSGLEAGFLDKISLHIYTQADEEEEEEEGGESLENAWLSSANTAASILRRCQNVASTGLTAAGAPGASETHGVF